MSNTDARFNGSIFRKDHPMILASRRDLASIKAIKLAYNSAGILAGTVLARNTTSGQYQAYAATGASGLSAAICVLLHDVDVTDFQDTSTPQIAQGVFGGELFYDKLIGIDATAVTGMVAKKIVTALGTNILKF